MLQAIDWWRILCLAINYILMKYRYLSSNLVDDIAAQDMASNKQSDRALQYYVAIFRSGNIRLCHALPSYTISSVVLMSMFIIFRVFQARHYSLMKYRAIITSALDFQKKHWFPWRHILSCWISHGSLARFATSTIMLEMRAACFQFK